MKYMKAEGNLLKCYKFLGSKGFVVPDAEPFAGLRVSDATEKGTWKKSEVCTNPAWMANGIVYDGENVLVTDSAHNPIIKNIHGAFKAHSDGRDFTLDNKTIEELRDLSRKHPEDARKTGVLLLTDRENLPVKNLANRQYSQFLFGKKAELYDALCQEAGISVIPVYFVSEEDAKSVGKPFGRALLVHSLKNKSILSGNNLDLGSDGYGYSGRTFGIPSAQRNSTEHEGIEKIIEAVKKGDGFEYKGVTYAPLRIVGRRKPHIV